VLTQVARLALHRLLGHSVGVELGAFSISLAVADLAAARTFYERLGFVATGGDPDEGWQILRNGPVTIGLFQGMFERDTLTFNPGLDGATMRFLDEFTDVRQIESHLLAERIPLETQVDPDSTGAGFLALTDPDDNPILIDQFDHPEGVDGLAPPELPTPPMPLQIGALTYRLAVSDLDDAAGFYRLLGFDDAAVADPGATTLRNGDAVLGLDRGASANAIVFDVGIDPTSREPLTRPYANLDEVESVAIGRGLSPDRSLVEPGRRAVAFRDPDDRIVLIEQHPR
jgi:catechol 2,3-dioxygenase-like lactoylglutathione lyase family enzyme